MYRLSVCVILLLLLTSVGSKAQSDSGKAQYISPGGGLLFGTEIGQPGINLRTHYNMPEKNLRGGLSFSYFFPDNEVIEKDMLSVQTNVWSVNLNGQYLYAVNDDITVYPLAGLNFSRVKATYEETRERSAEPSYTVFTPVTETAWGGNIGVGGQYELEEDVKPFLEVKYIISNYDQFVFTMGTYFLMK